MYEIIIVVLITATFAIGYASPTAAGAWLHRRETARED
jgi:hypothetical protein